ncbi:valacyclovir hydrolase-like [Coccinella septempunctata]|uniref:valacyclovir hydrolase-like n=1 Tax=Coccinella septempunctata TaxID=41139 RepID=UPI001D075CFF|nr:valacyclovir hydrolase-like [Coccinella septempunctata]
MIILKSLFSRVRVLRTKNMATFSTKPKEELISLDSQKINYLKIGNGPNNVLCFPGALGTIWSDFKPQIEGLDGQKFTVLVWEPPGHGFSRPPERLLTSKFYEEDADTAHDLIKALNFHPFSLLGWSDGGISGMIYAAKYPKFIEKLVIWGSNSYVHSKDIENYEKIRNIKNWSEKAAAPLKELYGAEKLQEIQNSWCDAMLEINRKGGDICDTLLKNIECPTLILHGDKDPLVGAEHYENLVTKIKGAKLHRFPDGKHNIHLRYAKEFNDIVTKFLLNEGK